MENYLTGNTVRLECSFLDFDGLPVEPEVIKLIIYDHAYTVIDTVIINAQNKIGPGEYYYDYVTEAKERRMYYEWYGEINGSPSLNRGQFRTSFI